MLLTILRYLIPLFWYLTIDDRGLLRDTIKREIISFTDVWIYILVYIYIWTLSDLPPLLI